MLNTMAELMSLDAIHPIAATSLSVPYVAEGDLDIMDLESPTQTIELDPVSDQTNESNSYINQTICASPILPSNQSLRLPDSLLPAITAFKDRSNSIRARVSSQRLVERYLVERGSCASLNPTIMNDFRLRIFGIDSDILESVLSTEDALNASIHDNLSCAVDAIIYDGKLPGRFTPSQTERVRNWFPSIQQIGKESVEGYALKTSFTTDTNLFIMKAPRNPKNDELVHEALIGFYALNKLRRILPNYMYVYGYVKCSPPVIIDKEVTTWCSSSNPAVSYLIAENIRDAVPIGDFITDPNTTSLDVLVVFYQIMNALNLAYKSYGYTHYDLHYGNIMVRKYPKIVAIPYFGVETKIIGYLASQYVPYLIDYGYSRITIGGVGFGKIGLESYGVEGTSAFPMFDTYKLIGFLGEALYTKPRTSNYANISILLEQLFSFFGNGTLSNRVKQRLTPGTKDWYNISLEYKSITHDNYISWLQNNSGIQVPVHVSLLQLMSKGVYTAPINTSMDTCSFYKMVTSDQGPETSLEYCEVIEAINTDSVLAPDIKQQAIQWLNSNFDSEEYFLDTIDSVDAIIGDITSSLQRQNIIFSISSMKDLTTAVFVDKYRAQILDLLTIKDYASSLVSYTKSNICALTSQGKFQNHRARIEAINTFNSEIINYLNAQRSILRNNLKYTQSIKWKSILSDTRLLAFWTKEHEILILGL